jgi:hypothetical protein
MTNDLLFQIAGQAALVGWAALALGRAAPVWSQRIAGAVVPLLLSIAYAGLILAFWSRAPGGFNSLGEVMALFTSAEIALAGWIHYLAFDLLVGAWEARVARREGIAFVLVLPCLALTFLFGPAGFLLFSAIRGARWLTGNLAKEVRP